LCAAQNIRCVPVSIYHLRYARLRKRLIAMRKAAGLTQVQLATRLGIGQSFWQQLLASHRRVMLRLKLCFLMAD
jgi:transcriptional regulator with XRE-family HTH domain